MRRDEETMVAIAEALASGTQSLQGAALSNGVPARTFWTWMKLSKEGDERFLIRWPDPDGEPVQFHRAVSMARKMLALQIRSEFERKSLRGYDRIVHFQGCPVPAPDPRAVGLSREVRELLGYDPDGYLRDEAGAVIWVTEHVEPPAAILIKYMASHFPEYRDHSVIDQNINGGLTLGVSTIERRTRQDGPPQIPPLPPVPRVVEVVKFIEAPAEPTNEAADDPDVTDTAPLEFEPPNSISEPVAAPEPERVIREPAPPAYTPTASERAGRPLSALEAELLGRLRGDPAKRSASPVGSIKSTLLLTTGPSE